MTEKNLNLNNPEEENPKTEASKNSIIGFICRLIKEFRSPEEAKLSFFQQIKINPSILTSALGTDPNAEISYGENYKTIISGKNNTTKPEIEK